jgi:hypothetical protein
MPYTPTNWQNQPSTATPLSADNLNKIETGVKSVTDVVDTGRLSDSALSGTYETVLVWASGAYPARPAGIAGGLVKYVGPAAPTGSLPGDEWVDNS